MGYDSSHNDISITRMNIQDCLTACNEDPANCKAVVHSGKKYGNYCWLKWKTAKESGNWVKQVNRNYYEKNTVSEVCSGTKCDGYRGFVSNTKSGKNCQKWTVQAPHKHENTPQKKPNKGLGDHNYCRNPDGEKTIWCYTDDVSKRWEYCDVG